MTPFLCGHVPDPVEHSLTHPKYGESSLIAGTPIVLAEDIDHRAYAPATASQIAQNCCGHGTRESAYSTALFARTPIGLPSCNFIWAGARLRGRPKVVGQPRLLDTGCQLKLMFEFMTEWGMIEEYRWPEQPHTINAVPPDDCFRKGENAVLKDYYVIPDVSDSSEMCKDALRRGYFPIFAMVVDDRWGDIGNKVWDSPGGNVLGGHCMTIYGYLKALDAFLVLNSWGIDWGFEGGYGLLSATAFNRYATDKRVIRVSPEVKS